MPIRWKIKIYPRCKIQISNRICSRTVGRLIKEFVHTGPKWTMTSGWAAIYYQLLLAHCPRMPGLNIIISTEWTHWFFFLLLSRSAGPRVVWLVPLLAIFLFLILYIYAAIFFFNPWLILSVVLPGLNYLESLVRFFRSLYTCCWSACQAQKKNCFSEWLNEDA